MFPDIELIEKYNLPEVKGRYSFNAPLGDVGWFRTGGRAEILFKPKDAQDLAHFLKNCPKDMPVTPFGVMSNAIIRDGGIKGVVVRLGRGFTDIEQKDETHISVGASALDIHIATRASQFNIEGLEFFSGIPGTLGGALRMNAGAYGTETKDVLVEASYLDRQGVLHTKKTNELGMTYRHSSAPEDAIFVSALLHGQVGDSDKIDARIQDIKTKRASTQPIKARTGGSTFANPSLEDLAKANLPEDTKVWQLIDKVGGRGYMVGGAQMSKLHCNFMINTGEASAQNLEDLGEEMRRRVKEEFGIELRWEIKRIGLPA